MSPILVRPVREQLEHDRIIRLLPARYKRRFEVGINPGSEQNAAVGSGVAAVYPDAVLYSNEKARKIQGVIEVETIESINHLEAMAEWAVYGRLKVPFHLYVPVAALDVARRLSSDHNVTVAEIWSFDNVGDQVRFTLVHRVPEADTGSLPAPRPPVAKPVKAAPKAEPKPAAAPKPAAPKTAARPVSAKPAKAAVAKPAAPKPAAAKSKNGGVRSNAAKPAMKGKPKAAPRAAAPARKTARSAARPAAKRTPAAPGRAAAARKGTSAPKRK